eukprot:2915799-Ditylum_brightwellii.AAC.1
MYVMTPAETLRADARTRLEASLTRDGKKTTAAPAAVATPAPTTIPKVTPIFGLFTDILYAVN